MQTGPGCCLAQVVIHPNTDRTCHTISSVSHLNNAFYSHSTWHCFCVSPLCSASEVKYCPIKLLLLFQNRRFSTNSLHHTNTSVFLLCFVLRWQAMQRRGLYSRHRSVSAARLHILLTRRLRAEEKWGRGGEGCGRCGWWKLHKLSGMWCGSAWVKLLRNFCQCNWVCLVCLIKYTP